MVVKLFHLRKYSNFASTKRSYSDLSVQTATNNAKIRGAVTADAISRVETTLRLDAL